MSDEQQGLPPEEPAHRPLDTPRPRRVLFTHSLGIDDIPRIKKAGHALAVLKDLQAKDLTAHPSMPYALIEQFFRVVAPNDPGLLETLCGKLLTLATGNDHAMNCILACFHEAARQYLLPHSIKALVRLVDTFFRQKPDVSSTFKNYLLPLQRLANSTADVGMPLAEQGAVAPDTQAIQMIHLVQKKEVVGIGWTDLDSTLQEEIIYLATPDSLAPEKYETLKEKWETTVDLMTVSKRALTEFGRKYRFPGILGDLRWTHRLIKLNSGVLASPELNIQVLIDDQPPLSNTPRARSRRTLMLVIAASEFLPGLYAQLCKRMAEPKLAPHMELQQLPAYTLLAGCLMHGPGSVTFHGLLEAIFDGLPLFGKDAKAQVLADLCAIHLLDEQLEVYENMLIRLATEESRLHLINLNHLKEMVKACNSKVIDLKHVIELPKILPLPGECWSMFGIVTIGFLSALYQDNVLSSEIVPELENQTAATFLERKAMELIRYFMSLSIPNQFQLFQSAAAYLFDKLTAAAFLRLSPQEKVRFLESYHPEFALVFVEWIVYEASDLSVAAKLRLVDEILSQKLGETMDAINALLRKWRFSFFLERELSGQL